MKSLAQKLEAYQTDAWCIDAILDVELLTPKVFDPCCGFGVMGDAAKDRGYKVTEMDIHDWSGKPDIINKDFLMHFDNLFDTTVFMNPPFSKACQFVDHARMMNARKIVCFQRYAWREGSFGKGEQRGAWWEANPPSRTWLCGDRAQCLRFDLIGTQVAKPPTAHAWFVWERGHRGAEVTRALYKNHNYHV